MRKFALLRRTLSRLLKAGALPAFAVAVFCLYRWAERPPETFNTTVLSASKRMVAVRLENAPFTAYAENRKSWSLRAARIDLERLPGSAFSHIESATLTDIRQGVLYRLPDTLPSPKAGSRPRPETSATYHARMGRYALGESEPLTPDLALTFRSVWQFRLEGDVVFRTASGDELRAPTLTILEMTNNRTKKRERRVVCESGVTIQMHGMRIQSNQLRYNPDDRTVECMNGVRGTFQAGFVQAERAYWSPTQQTLTCPAAVSGTMQGMPFQAADVMVDVGRSKVYANQLHLELRMTEEIVR